MTTYRCRLTVPRVTDWTDVRADSPEMAANEFHDRNYRGTLWHVPDPDLPGTRIYFALVEVDGHEPTISRIYWSGIVRTGGVRRRLTLAEIAKQLGWAHPPEELLSPGLDGEEMECT